MFYMGGWVKIYLLLIPKKISSQKKKYKPKKKKIKPNKKKKLHKT